MPGRAGAGVEVARLRGARCLRSPVVRGMLRVMSAADKDSRSPNPVDVYVGARIRSLRNLRGLRQEDLARAVGVKFQQLQKYECGSNRVSASRLVMIAKALQIPVAELFGRYSGERGRGLQVGSLDDAVLRGRAAAGLLRRLMRLDDDARSIVEGVIAGLAKLPRPRRRRRSG